VRFLHRSSDSVYANLLFSHLPSHEGKLILVELDDYSHGGEMNVYLFKWRRSQRPLRDGAFLN